MKYVIEIMSEYEDSIKGLMILGVKNSDLLVDALSVESLEELNSDYINEHFAELQDTAYQKGLDDAWECAKKISLMSPDEIEKVFPGAAKNNRYNLGYSGTEAIEKLKAYEQQKADEIKVGDVITDGKCNYLVIEITDNSYIALQGTDFEPSYIGKDYIKSYHNLNDSKDMQKIAEEINKAMKGGDA